MDNFLKKGIVKKTIIVLIFLTVFNFIYPYIPVNATNVTEENEKQGGLGGILMAPVISLLTFIGDGLISMEQRMLLGMDDSFITIKTDSDGKIGAFFGGIVGGIATAVGAVLSGGVSLVVGAVLTIAGTATGNVIGGKIQKEFFPDKWYLPIFLISPAEIFSGLIPVFDINFINPMTEDSEGNEVTDTPAIKLQQTISNWYVALRNLVLVAYMIILLYIGIRIVISSTAGEKAKYKEHVKDWLIGLLILVFMHYIMAFSIEIVKKIDEFLIQSNKGIDIELSEEALGEIEDSEISDSGLIYEKDGKTYLRTNLMGTARIRQQQEKDENGDISIWTEIGYTAIYLVLVFYTLMFTIKYLKRVVYMAFLTVMAPIMSLTYPIDKMRDGKSQAFDMWLKEYLFNLLLQPLHLVLYTVTVGMAMDLAEENMLYALVAIGFLLPAEKLLRKFFGFEKSSTAASVMSGAVGGAMAMNAINGVGKLLSSKSGGKKSSGGSNGGAEDTSSKIRTADKGMDTGNLLDEAFGNGDNMSEGDDGMNPLTLAGAGMTGNGGNDSGASQRSGNGGGIPSSPESPTSLTPDDIRNDPNKFETLERFKNSNFAQGVGNVKKGMITGVKDMGQKVGARTKKITGAAGGWYKNTKVGKAQRWTASHIKNPQSMYGRDLKKLANKGAKTGKRVFKAVGANLSTTAQLLNENKGKIARGVLKTYGAATLGVAGMAAGLASDDYSNVFKYGAAGAGVGAMVGDKPLDMVSGIASGAKKGVEGYNDRYLQNRYSTDEYKKRMNEKMDKEFLKDKQKQKMYKDKFGEAEYEQAMKDALEYRKYGVTDDKMIMKAMNLKNVQDQSRVSKERIGFAKIASTAKDKNSLEAYEERLASRGVEEERIKAIRNTIREMQSE